MKDDIISKVVLAREKVDFLITQVSVQGPLIEVSAILGEVLHELESAVESQ
jgi:hypothetical protein